MYKNLIKSAIILSLPLTIAGCNTTSGGGSTTVAAMATQGGIDPATGLRQFPDTISGGDGFQANPTNDASFATLINSVRADAGAPAVTYNAQLNTAAQNHSDDMFATGNFSHTGSGNTSVGDRATAAGYVWTTIGENIARGQPNENVAMNGWVTSAPHQANNINPAFKEFGLGRTGTGSQTYWTLVLGAQ